MGKSAPAALAQARLGVEIKDVLNLLRRPHHAPSAEGRLVYAVGDIHGRFDLLQLLLDQIVEDVRRSPPVRRPLLVFLGDYVDRGPASLEVIYRILELSYRREFEVRALKGNHEEALLRFLEDPATGVEWFTYGGRPTLRSYGLVPPERDADLPTLTRARDAFARRLPTSHQLFFERLASMAVVGDYAFVHAGVRPGVPLSGQAERDLLWIRREFLDHPGPYEKVIVHGHTPTEQPELLGWRLGIDTGAYATGVLTALRIDDSGHRLLQARAGTALPLSHRRSASEEHGDGRLLGAPAQETL